MAVGPLPLDQQYFDLTLVKSYQRQAEGDEGMKTCDRNVSQPLHCNSDYLFDLAGKHSSHRAISIHH